jgi:hypothetical protein
MRQAPTYASRLGVRNPGATRYTGRDMYVNDGATGPEDARFVYESKVTPDPLFETGWRLIEPKALGQSARLSRRGYDDVSVASQAARELDCKLAGVGQKCVRRDGARNRPPAAPAPPAARTVPAASKPPPVAVAAANLSTSAKRPFLSSRARDTVAVPRSNRRLSAPSASRRGSVSAAVSGKLKQHAPGTTIAHVRPDLGRSRLIFGRKRYLAISVQSAHAENPPGPNSRVARVDSATRTRIALVSRLQSSHFRPCSAVKALSDHSDPGSEQCSLNRATSTS